MCEPAHGYVVRLTVSNVMLLAIHVASRIVFGTADLPTTSPVHVNVNLCVTRGQCCYDAMHRQIVGSTSIDFQADQFAEA